MSFGFSPGDIALFAKFITKVIDALKDEGGSQFEYQSAIQQCQDVLDLMDDVAQLDFSSVPQSLKTKVEARLESTKSIVSDFKTMIARYENSMGKSSKRNAAKSALRKVQWAFDAAEDLSRFQPRLSAQLHMVQIVLQMSVWKFLNVTPQSNRLLAAPKPTQLVEDSRSSSRQLPYMLNRGLLDQDQVQGLAVQITDLVYQRLLTRPSIGMNIPGRAFTLPGDEAAVMLRQPQHAKSPPENSALGSGMIASISSPSQTTSRQEEGNTSSHKNKASSSSVAQYKPTEPLIEEINEHLHELNLGLLSDAEIQGLDDIALPRLLSADSHEMPESDHNGPVKEENPQPRRRFRTKFRAPGVDPLSTLSLASNIIQFVDFAARIANQANLIYRDNNSGNDKFRTFSGRVTQYTQLLNVVAETVMAKMDEDGLQSSITQLLSETQRALSEARDIFERYIVGRASGSKITAARLMFTWKRDLERISGVMDEIEVLKANLIIILQTSQIRAQSRIDFRLKGQSYQTVVV
ncbi:unnamed protein product [Periconia digitata]|uniref:Fungal N-terminal domain-containing protein n=1 Tax=Periconia digitata TaxID=1303443 RepID=A0A9W4UW14_9PLEO|nr:unnamed protein product [Periconia digitata]